MIRIKLKEEILKDAMYVRRINTTWKLEKALDQLEKAIQNTVLIDAVEASDRNREVKGDIMEAYRHSCDALNILRKQTGQIYDEPSKDE